MKRSFSLRSQLFILMALLVLLQSVALVGMLIISRVFLMLDAESFRIFENATHTRAQTYNASVGSLVGNMAMKTQALSSELQAYAAENGIEEALLYAQDTVYLEVAEMGTQTLLLLLEDNTVSGAFFLLNGSNADKKLQTEHSGVYLRNSSTQGGTGSLQLEVGPISVSQKNTIPTSINWRLDMPEGKEAEDFAYYTRPMEAAEQSPRAEMERYGYWSMPPDILQDGQQVVTYTMPLIGKDQKPFGVLGVEISLTLMTQQYISDADLPYQNSFYGISRLSDDTIHLDWYIPSGPVAQVYLQQGGNLKLKEVATTNVYATEIDGLGDMYCAVEPLVMYSRNSPFYAESWSLVGYVPQDVLHETSSGVRNTLVVSIAVTTVFAFAAIFLIVFATTRKISGLSKYVQGLSPYAEVHFTRTGIREIDELMTAVENLNQSVQNASKTTSKILELTLMPLGGYEVIESAQQVVLTEYIYKLLNLPPGEEITVAAWNDIHDLLVAEPAQGYENIYHYMDYAGDEKWLRILEAPTDTGHVGIVVDTTKDIEEHRRLAHELDYDALTHLYSRTAFKREAFGMIRENPDKIGAMVFIDLDNLKYMNDTYGHEMGDRLIIRAAEMFRLFEQEGGVVSRISGDEFAIYLHGFGTKAEAKAVIERVLQRKVDYTLHTSDGQTQRIRFSAGIAYYPTDSQDITDLLKLSDYAMYEAKHSQKGAMFEFNKDSYKENAYLLENREAINLLLDEELIRFAFQPIVDVKTGEIYAFEALMRPLLDNFKSPMEILGVAAAQSKLGQLERVVVMLVFQVIREHKRVLGDRKVFINSIPSQSLSDEDELVLVRNYADLFPHVVVEVTEEENASPENLERKRSFIHKHGMLVALDDFGSGYSNEIRMLSMEPDIVKVDIEMISHIDSDPDKQQLLTNLVSFCRPKGIRLVAEGVERREELAMLIKLGVDYVQGYYLGRPAFDMQDISDKVKKEILFLQGMQ